MILAVDTSGATGAALVDERGEVVAVQRSDDPRGHAEAIGPLLEAVLGASAAEVTAVAYGVGPGPFTGLRVGMAAARTVALVLGVPELPVLSHDAIALAALSGGAVLPLVVVADAKRREVYSTVYRGVDAAGLPQRAGEPQVGAPDALPDLPRGVRPRRRVADRPDRGPPPRGRDGSRALRGALPAQPRRDPQPAEAGRLVIALRAVGPGDLDPIMAIETRQLPDRRLERRDDADDPRPIRTRSALVAVDGETVVGYAAVLAPQGAGDADVLTIAVAGPARGQGAGRALLTRLIAAAADRGAHRVFLEVRADNPVATALYASAGFEAVGRRPHYYQPDDVDAVVMRLELPVEVR